MIDRYGFLQQSPTCSDGWSLSYLVPPTQLVGANGMRFSAEGQLYVAQAFGGQISAIDVETGGSRVISPANGDIIAPDDLAFDSHGNLYATEVMSARVSVRRPNGETGVVAGNVPVANGIVVHNDRIFVSEFRADGRILELYPDGSTPRLICEQLMAPNALSVGVDNYLYFPLVPLGEVWRVAIEGGQAERVASGFNIPTAVKFDAQGYLIVVEAGDGSITRVDVQDGSKTCISKVAYGIDNLAFDKFGQLFVSHFTDGSIVKVGAEGANTTIHGGGMLGPFGMCSVDGETLLVADGMSIAQISCAGVQRPAMLLQHGFPGYVRSVASLADGRLLFANSAGGLMTYMPGEEAETLADGFDRLMGISVDASGLVYACESGSGKVICIDGKNTLTVLSGLKRPTGIACGLGGSVFVSESDTGNIHCLEGGQSSVIATGFSEPQGLAIAGDRLYVLDRGDHSLTCVELGSREMTVLANNLPLGTIGGVQINTLPGIDDLMPGPLLPFSDIAILVDGRICISGDANGSVLTLKRMG